MAGEGHVVVAEEEPCTAVVLGSNSLDAELVHFRPHWRVGNCWQLEDVVVAVGEVPGCSWSSEVGHNVACS